MNALWARRINLALGVWLFFAPWVLRQKLDVARYNDHWVGLFIAAIAVMAVERPALRFLNLALGAWLVIAPVVFHYRGASWVNDVIVGCGVVAFALTVPAPRGRPA